jgi:hypothetical protein
VTFGKMKGHTKMTPETNKMTNDPIIYQVMIHSEIYAIQSYPYIGKDKEIAMAIAAAYIAKGETTTINELRASELKAQFDRENKS